MLTGPNPPGTGGSIPPSITGSGGVGDGAEIGTAGRQPVIAARAGSTGTLAIANSSGGNSTASLTIQSGGTLTLHDFTVSSGNATNTGTLTITDTGSNLLKLALDGGTYGLIGGSGSGTLNILNGATLGSLTNTSSRAWLSLGGRTNPNLTKGTGVVNISGSGSAWLAGTGWIGDQGGNGILNLSNGGRTTNVGLVVGNTPGSTGAVNVSGTGTVLDAGIYGLSVGTAGSGTLNIAAGASATTNQLQVGGGDGGTVTVDGVGSILNVQGVLSMAAASDVRFTNGAIINVAMPIAGAAGAGIGIDTSPGRSSTLSVTGAGTVLSLNGRVTMTNSLSTLSSSITIGDGGKMVVTPQTNFGSVESVTIGGNVGGGGPSSPVYLLLNSGGTLQATNVTNVTIGGNIRGVGTLTGPLLVHFGGAVMPGDGTAAGTLSVGPTTFSTAGIYTLKLNNDPATGGAGSGWSRLAISGALDLTTAAEVTVFKIALSSVAGDATTWNGAVPHTWSSFITTTGGITGFSSGALAIDAAGFKTPNSGFAFSVVKNGYNLDLIYGRPGAPAFTMSPRSQTTSPGSSVTFTAAASGAPAPTYQWQKDGVNIAGATAASLTLNPVQVADSGSYTVVATNALGVTISSPVTLDVNAPAAITQQPQGYTVNAGTNVTLRVVATGAPAPTYQWRKNGVAIAGATLATFTLLTAQTWDTGSFSAVVTNSSGAVMSAPAVVTVNRGPDAALDGWAWRNPLPQGHRLNGITWGGNQWVAVGAGGTVLTSADAISWIRRTPASDGFFWSVAKGASLYAAVGDDGLLRTSLDGTSWTSRNAGTTEHLYGVVWSGNQYVAVGSSGKIITSADGIAWTSRNSGVTSFLAGVIWAGGRFVAVGGQTILTSVDGTAWTQTSAAGQLLAIAMGNNQFVAVGTGGVVMSSIDGMNWSVRTSGTTSDLESVVWNGSQFVACGDGGIVLTSADGSHWTSQSSGTTAFLAGVAWNGSQLVAIGVAGTTLTSTNGVTWANRSSGPTDEVVRVAWGGSQFLAVGDAGSILASADGAAWASRVSGTDKKLRGVVCTPALWFAIGDGGTILKSIDSVSWDGIDSGTTSDLVGAAWNGKRLVVVGSGGTLMATTDGENWDRGTVGSSDYYGAVWNGNQFVVVGANGTILTSPDGLLWSIRASGTALPLWGVAWNGSQYVAVGEVGVVLVSADGITWTAANSGTTAFLNAISWVGSKFVAVGESGVVLSSPDGVTWTQHSVGTANWLHGVAWSGRQLVTVGDDGTILSTGISGVLPTVTTQPQNRAATAGGSATFSVAVPNPASASYEWRLNGISLGGASGSSLTVANIQPENAGIYSAVVVTATGSASSDAAILGVTTTSKVIGAGTELLPVNIAHPNGNIFDQVLVTGSAETITADANQVTRTSFIDLNDDIVQVEFTGAGTLSLVLDVPSGPASPLNYNQAVTYMKGHAGIVVTGANETTNLSIFSVGRVNAFDPTGVFDILRPISATNNPANNGSSLFVGHASTAYDGVADIAFIAIASINGKFGGLRASNANCFSTQGLTGIYAPGVQFTGPVYIHDIFAIGTALPMFVIGSSPDTRITGGDLLQANGQPVKVAGLTQLKFTAGSTSNNVALSAQTNKAILQQNGVDVTAQIVVNP